MGSRLIQGLAEPRITLAERIFWIFGSISATLLFLFYAGNGWQW
jgi:hypothetical protein